MRGGALWQAHRSGGTTGQQRTWQAGKLRGRENIGVRSSLGKDSRPKAGQDVDSWTRGQGIPCGGQRRAAGLVGALSVGWGGDMGVWWVGRERP